MNKNTLIAGGVAAAAVVGILWYRSRSSGGSAQSAQNGMPSGSITPFYNMPAFSALPSYTAGAVPVVSNVGGVTPVNVGDYISAFTSAPAVMTPTIGLVTNIQNYGGLNTSTYAQNNQHAYSAGASYGFGGFSIGGQASGKNFAQNTVSSTSLTSGQNITFAS